MIDMEISERAAQLAPSLTLSIDSKAKAMKAEGIDVCGFGAGEPDFDTPEHIKAAAIAALEAGFTKYTPSSGIPELRQAIAEKLAVDNQLTYRATQVVVSNGAKHACYNAVHEDVDSEQPVQSDRLGLHTRRIAGDCRCCGRGRHLHFVGRNLRETRLRRCPAREHRVAFQGSV